MKWKIILTVAIILIVCILATVNDNLYNKSRDIEIQNKILTDSCVIRHMQTADSLINIANSGIDTIQRKLSDIENKTESINDSIERMRQENIKLSYSIRNSLDKKK